MHGYFLFPCELPTRPQEQALVIFCAASSPDPDDFEEHLRSFCDQNPPPDRIYVIGSQADQERIQQAVHSDQFVSRLPSVTRHLNPPTVDMLFFGLDGLTGAEDHCSHIRRLGMTYIFRHRNALLEATSAHHYVKPSERHCDKFLRTANALIDGAEIDFIAFCCLSRVAPNIAHLYCDTGAISSIAYAIVALRRRLSDTEPIATIDSYGSYEGMRDFHFKEMHRSAVLLSASTSGGLAKGLIEIEPGITNERLTTIFYLGDDGDHGRIVCDLRFHPANNPEGYEPLVSFAAHECLLCSQGSTPIPIAGDQFLPEGIRIDPVIIRAADSPSWLAPFIKDVSGKNFVRTHYQVPYSSAGKDVFLDVQALFADSNLLNLERFRKRFHRMIDHGAGIALKRIIHLDDEGSRHMASAIRTKAGCGDEVQILSLSTIEQDLNAHIHETGLTVVAAGAVASGSMLLAASQVLRHIQKNGSVNYMVGIARTPDQATLRDLRGHVTYGPDQADEHGFHLMDRVFLPMYRAGRETSWDQERNLVLRLIEKNHVPATEGILEARLGEIDAAASNEVRGLVDTLFLRTRNGDPLTLRPGFAFLNFDYDQGQVSQAEVYFVIAAVLHHLRLRDTSSHSLSQHSHVRKVISPRCFERFNDGVIQAALLRAGLTPELDYSLSDQLSAQMERILDFVFTNAANQSGEAAREFALALALKKLRLQQEGIARLKEAHEGTDDQLLAALWSEIEVG